MLDHVSLGASDIERSRRFYDAALRPLGLVRIVDFGAGRGSDYGAAPDSLGVELTPIPGAPKRWTEVAEVDGDEHASFVEAVQPLLREARGQYGEDLFGLARGK
jgi:catechol 2,3-dioxygenase-like lactoylglutathione lyase family enzyme